VETSLNLFVIGSPLALTPSLQIFGPVLTVLTFCTPKEAITLANNTRYGLGANVWTENVNLALETAISLKTGGCWVNARRQWKLHTGLHQGMFMASLYESAVSSL